MFCSCKRENLSFFGFAIKETMFIRFDDRMISKEQGGREQKEIEIVEFFFVFVSGEKRNLLPFWIKK